MTPENRAGEVSVDADTPPHVIVRSVETRERAWSGIAKMSKTEFLHFSCDI